jgi:parallel beta-helix repeat protein
MSHQGANSETGHGRFFVLSQKEADMKRHFTSMVLAILLLGMLSTGAVQAAPGTRTIRDDATGGDCTTIGVWDPATKTCTLTMDLTDSIVIENVGITLDGNGHEITGDGTGIGVEFLVGGATTIENLSVSQFATGIEFENGSITITHSSLTDNGIGITGWYGNITITHSSISDNGNGLRLIYTSGSVSHNIVSNNDVGIYCIRKGGRTISSNTISNNAVAMMFDDDNYSVITNNLFKSNKTLIGMTDYAITQFYNNNIVDNGSPLVEPMNYWGGIFNRPAPIGGNYWSDYYTPVQGCGDLNNDGFCDAPYILHEADPYFGVMQDNLPWTRMNGWLVVDLDNLIAEKERACDLGWINKPGICNSLGAKLNAAKASIERGQLDTALNQLNAFINALNAQKGKAVNQQAYDILMSEVIQVLNLPPQE